MRNTTAAEGPDADSRNSDLSSASHFLFLTIEVRSYWTDVTAALLPGDQNATSWGMKELLTTHQLTPALLCTSYFTENRVIVF